MDRDLNVGPVMPGRFEPEAERLEGLQANQNDGRGVSCVRSIVSFLRRGQWEQARAVTEHEWDKIRAYPEIAEACKGMGLLRD